MRTLTTALITATIAVSAAACGGGSSGGGNAATVNPTANPATAKADITTLYRNFFSSSIPQAKTMLEDGASLSKAFQIANKLKGSVTESAKVKTVTLTGPTSADVTFELDGNGSPLIQNSDGKAVFQNGHWLVAKQTFCALVSLGYSKPIPNCT
jgi:hypothetical protein